MNVNTMLKHSRKQLLQRVRKPIEKHAGQTMKLLGDGQITRPIIRYHGGKWRLAPWIISHFPTHRVYVEPFGGGGLCAAA